MPYVLKLVVSLNMTFELNIIRSPTHKFSVDEFLVKFIWFTLKANLILYYQILTDVYHRIIIAVQKRIFSNCDAGRNHYSDG